MFETPILYLIFNRPDLTEITFARIREIRPKFLFIAADGPRKNKEGEIQLVKKTREIVNKVDWDCELKTLFRDDNLGCGKAVSEAISWFFEHVDQGIILEDDVLPETSFFYFCQNLLDFYKDNKRVMSIGGTNVLLKWKENVQDYHFSYQGSIWGWATWKRAWKLYSYNIRGLNNPFIKYRFKKISLCPEVYKRRINTFKQVKQIDTWDYQWAYTRFKNRGLTVIPALNQVKNLGFNINGTHTTVSNSKLENLPTFNLELDIRLTEKVRLDVDFEKKFLDYLFMG